MWIRKLHDLGNSTALVVPRDVARQWQAARVRYVEIELHSSGLMVHPLTDDELLRRPSPEEEVPLPRGSSDPEPR